jgi:4-amino-4-deoxy-L-arabinose transferase-like glycosyltransferase
MNTQQRSCTPWWLELDVVWLVLLVLAAYFLRAGELPLRGEESTRAQTALEMVAWADPIVPREQGEPKLVRPPLQSWAIAASCLAQGNWDTWAVRLPSQLATLLTTLLIYGYCRSFLSRLGSFAAAAAFATMADMLQMGRQAETEAIFILFLSVSLLVWHWGMMRGWPDGRTFALGYGLMALAMLTKGLQAPAYFVGSITVYLALTKQWPRLFGRGHLLGALVGAALVLAWTIPYYRALGWSGVASVWLGDPAYRFNASIQNWRLPEVLSHLLVYPLEIVAGTLPWSLILLAYLRRDFRAAIGRARLPVLFHTICLAVAFPTCWIPPGGQARYFAPLFPCLAVLIGLAVQRCAEADVGSFLRMAWARYITLNAWIMAAGALVVLGTALCWAHHPRLWPWAEPPLVALLDALLGFGLALLALRLRNGGPGALRAAVGILACAMTLAFSGPIMDIRLRRSEYAAEAVQRLKAQLPAGKTLVSLGDHIDTLFAYYYGRPFIAPRPWPACPAEASDLEYFCFGCYSDEVPLLPFSWEQIGTVSMDRNHHPVPHRRVIVGHRLPAAPVAN